MTRRCCWPWVFDSRVGRCAAPPQTAARAAGGDSAGARARSHAADRSGGEDRAAAERHPLFHPPERAARQSRGDAARRQRRRDPGGRRSARPRALPRAHGLQRHRALQAGRAGVVPRIDRRALRPARQRLDVVRRNDLHARDPDRSAGLRRSRHDGAAGFRRRHLAAARRSREGARRRPRRMARPSRRRIAADRQAAAGDLPGIALCRAPADRIAGDPEERAAREAGGVLSEVVSPRSDGGGRGRRHPGGRGREAGDRALRRHSRREGRAGDRRHQRARAQGNVDQHVNRSGGAGLVGVGGVQGQGRARRHRPRLSQDARREPAVADVQPPAPRHRAAAERAVPWRASGHQRASAARSSCSSSKRWCPKARSPRASAR